VAGAIAASQKRHCAAAVTVAKNNNIIYMSNSRSTRRSRGRNSKRTLRNLDVEGGAYRRKKTERGSKHVGLATARKTAAARQEYAPTELTLVRNIGTGARNAVSGVGSLVYGVGRGAVNTVSYIPMAFTSRRRGGRRHRMTLRRRT
jgi:hypothetical protein